MNIQEVTRGLAGVGGLAVLGRGDGAGVIHTTPAGSLARTDTADKDLFTWPAGCTPLGILAFAAAGSDAGTTAVIDAGISGTDTKYIDAASVAGSAGKGVFFPANQANMMAAVGNADVPVVGKYAETGTASANGGPWLLVGLYQF